MPSTLHPDLRENTVSLRTIAGLVAAAVIGALAGWQLSTYSSVPIDAAAAHGLMAGTIALLLITRMAGKAVTEHRCPDCDFRVEVTNPVASEESRWALVAADHPAHAYRP